MNKKIGLLLCIILLTSTASAFVSEWNDISDVTQLNLDYPEDLSLLAYSGGFDTWSPIYLLYLDATENVYYSICDYENRETGNFELISQFSFNEEEIMSLWETVTEGDFFNLDQEYGRNSVIGGSYANLTITGNGMTHSVQTVNIDVDAFDAIIKMLNSLSPNDNDLIYNALYNNAPIKPGTPNGSQNGDVNTPYSYTTDCFDADGDPLYVFFDWGDETDGDWQGSFNSGDEISVEKSWTKQGSYNIKVKVIDDPNNDGDVSDGKESAWSESLQVSMPKNKIKEVFPFLQYFEKFLSRFPLLKNMVDTYNKEENESLMVTLGDPDSESGTTAKRNGCEITIEIRITFYGDWIDKAKSSEISIVETKVENDIENKWNKDKWDKDSKDGPDGEDPWRVQCDIWCEFWEPGCTVKFDAIIDHKKNVNASEIPKGGNAKPGKGGSHWIEAIDPNTPVKNSHVNAWNNKLPTPNNGMETTGQFNTNDYAGVYAHEAGHLMGLGDHQVDVEVDNPNGPGKVTTKSPTKKNPDGTWNIMAWPGGWPGQDDINTIVSSSGVGCPCDCCEYPWVFFIDDFEDPDGGWTIKEYDTNTHPWKRELYDNDVYEPPGSGSYYMEADSKESGSSAYLDTGLFTPGLDLTGFTSVTLEFDRNFQDTTGQSRAAICMYSGGLEESQFEEFLLEITTSDPSDGTHTVLTFNPSTYKDPSEVYINFYYTDNGVDNEKFCIDNILIGAN